MKYLIYCGPGIGDIILILPMLRRIKENDSKAFIKLFMASDKNRVKLSKQMLCLQGDVDVLDYYSLKEKTHLLSFILRMGYRKYDWAFVLQYTDNQNTSKWPCRIAQIAAKKTCGIKHNSHPEIKYDVEIERADGYRIADYPMLMLDAAGIERRCVDTSQLVNRAVVENAFREIGISPKARRRVGLVVGTASVGGTINGVHRSNDAKKWPSQNWIELSRALLRAGYGVVLLGGNREREEMKDLQVPGEAINLLGKCTILQSMGALSHSSLVIGADTGLMHCAGALDIPSLTLFGCTDYREYLPFGGKSYYIASGRACSPCFGTDKSLTCEGKDCMREISVEDVFVRAMEILEKG